MIRQTMEDPIVRKRCVLHLGGYEPMPPERHHYRFERELRRFEKTWSVAAKVSQPALSGDGRVASWRVETNGPNWRVETDFRLLRWDDIVAADGARPEWSRLVQGIAALADFVVTGTAFRYFYMNWRYGLFFLYPIVLLSFIADAAILIAVLGIRFGVPPALAAVLGAAAFPVLARWPGRAVRLTYMLDDWIFARDFARRRRTELDDRIDRFARELIEQCSNPELDEIVVSGHSLGAALALLVVDRALSEDALLAQNVGRLSLLSIGSSLLKIGLHPAAGWVRTAVDRVTRAVTVNWCEYQSLVDIISFYKANPVAAMKLPPRDKPVVRTVRIRAMLQEETYRTFHGNFLRMHRQFVMGNEKRYFYDFYMICCGPVSLRTRAHLPDAAVASFGHDGTFARTGGEAVAVGGSP